MIKTRTIIDVALCDLNTGQIDWLPKNPRTWSQADLDRTVASLKEDPDWIEDKPLSVVPYRNEAGELRYCVFCGNLRNSAQKELCIEKTPAFIYDPDAPDVGHEKEKRTPEQIETDRETIRRRAIKDNGTFGSWDADELANWDVEPDQLLNWGVPDWVMGGAGTGAKESKAAENPVGPDGYGEGFTLPSGEKSKFQEMHFQLSAAQATAVQAALKAAQELNEFKDMDVAENSNSNGRALALIVKQWEEQRKS